VKKAFIAAFFIFITVFSASGWRILYKEQYYKLYHEQLHHYPEDTMESMFYLQQALKADFCNPLYALAKINDKTDWERYRYLFTMHVNLRLVYLSLTLGSKYDKMVAYFYNEPWKRQNLESLVTAEELYRSALAYWSEAKTWSLRAWGLRDVHLEKIQEWEDENMRIETGELNYAEIITKQLTRLQKVRQTFQNMDENTY
jgi:hypothetical protein